jgi:hypothetical protein
MMDRIQEANSRSVRHQGYDGQKLRKHSAKVSVIGPMMDKNKKTFSKSGRHLVIL